MPMIRHELDTEQRDVVLFQSFCEDPFKRVIIFRFVKNLLPSIASIQRMVQSASFVRSWWSWHASKAPLRLSYRESMSPDPFDLCGWLPTSHSFRMPRQS